ncbi:MAG: hypothetical protein LH470_04880 [Lysobacter sp.]|nr:hypothetical protein [Lysobacter sp.]
MLSAHRDLDDIRAYMAISPLHAHEAPDRVESLGCGSQDGHEMYKTDGLIHQAFHPREKQTRPQAHMAFPDKAQDSPRKRPWNPHR